MRLRLLPDRFPDLLAHLLRPYAADSRTIPVDVPGAAAAGEHPLHPGSGWDANWNEVTWSKLTISALKILGATAMSGLFLFLQRRILIGMSRNIEYDLREDFYRRLVNQPLSFFHEHRTGDLMARGGISQRLVRWVASMVGGVRGYLPQTALGTTVVFSAISGSTTAAVAAPTAQIRPSAAMAYW